MKIRVLGCYGGETPGFRTSCFLINNSFVIDAGGITSALTLAEQSKITTIILSHSHFDHCKDVAFLADNVFESVRGQIRIAAVRPVLSSLKTHFLNNNLWPDFTMIPRPGKKKPVYTMTPLTFGRPIKIDGLTVTAIPVRHTVDAAGFIVNDGTSSIVYSGDTGPTEDLWKEANKLRNLKAVFIETSFPNSMVEFSTRVGHLSPCTLEAEIRKIAAPGIPYYVYHLKPQYIDVLKKEIRAIGNPRISLAIQGATITV